MKIAILSCFYPYRGGIAQFNASLLGELERICEVRAFNFKRQYPDILFPGKTQYVTPEDEAVPVEAQALLDTVSPFSWARTAKAIRKWEPDVLIMRYWMPWFAPSLGYVARRMTPGCKVIGILDNVIPHEQHFFDKALTGWFLKGLDGCITLCKEVASDLLTIAPDARYTVLPHPIYSHFGEKMQRTEAEKILNIRSGMKNLLFFGLIREYKGLDILLEAFDMLGEGYQLIIAGEPYGSFEKYQKIIDSSPRKEHIHLFPNYIKDSEVSRYFSAADVAVLPYRSATQSGISSIAWHFEVPMIVTAVGGLKETIGDRGTGIAVQKADPALVAEAIENFFSSKDTKERCIECIREEKDRLSWKRFASGLIDFTNTIQ